MKLKRLDIEALLINIRIFCKMSYLQANFYVKQLL